MKKYLVIALLLITSCGYTSVDNELLGQPKKLYHQTPIICPNRTDLDISLGVMRNGVGSMSTQDLYLTVPNKQDVDKLNSALSSGKLVKLHYNILRWTLCQRMESVTSVEILD